MAAPLAVPGEPSPAPTHVYKILLPAEYEAAAAAGAAGEPFGGTDFDRASGFIHLCSGTQLQGVLERFFGGVEEVVVLRLEYARLRSDSGSGSGAGAGAVEVKWEGPAVQADEAEGELFPHVYGGLDTRGVGEGGTVDAVMRLARPFDVAAVVVG